MTQIEKSQKNQTITKTSCSRFLIWSRSVFVDGVFGHGRLRRCDDLFGHTDFQDQSVCYHSKCGCDFGICGNAGGIAFAVQTVCQICALAFVFPFNRPFGDHVVHCTGDGNRSWIRFDFMPIGFQPAEFVKIFFILTFAYHLGRVRDRRQRPLTVLFLLFHAGIIIGLIVLQGGPWHSAGVCLSVFVYAVCSRLQCLVFPDYGRRKQRWYRRFCGNIFSNPIKKSAFYVVLIHNAIRWDMDIRRFVRNAPFSGGGFWGQGYLQGTISQNPVNSALPARWTDMIFAVMGEELGFFGIMLYLLLLTALVMRILFVARKTRNSWGSLICIGVCAVFICQAMENIGMCLGMLPVIGLTLPFMSYGGSSVVTLFVLVGLVQCVERYHDTTYGEEF